MSNLAFINWRIGKLAKNSSYDTRLYKPCGEAGVSLFFIHGCAYLRGPRNLNRNAIQSNAKALGHASIRTIVNIRNPHNEKTKQPKYYKQSPQKGIDRLWAVIMRAQ